MLCKKSLAFIFLLHVVSISLVFAGIDNDVYKDAESNGIATVICNGIKFMRVAVIPIAGILLSMTGLAAFQGKLNFTSLITLAIGLGVFRNTSPLLKMIAPNSDLHYECKCITNKKILRRIIDGSGESSWEEVIIQTGLDEDCNPI